MFGTQITIVGNVVDDVVLRQTSSGFSRLSFRVANTERRRDRDTGQWVDGDKLFVGVTFWREFAENVALSLKKGDPIIVKGRIFSRQYVKDESNHVSYEIDPESIGPDLARGVSKFDKRRRGYSGSIEVDPNGYPVRPVEDGYIMVGEDAAPTVTKSERELEPSF
jgi:single-strand DNA-binding protein